jgi:hypothetical protein
VASLSDKHPVRGGICYNNLLGDGFGLKSAETGDFLICALIATRKTNDTLSLCHHITITYPLLAFSVFCIEHRPSIL